MIAEARPNGQTRRDHLLSDRRSSGDEAHIITWTCRQSIAARGVGTALLAEPSGGWPRRGVRGYQLETATDNEAGIAFWQRHGYRTRAADAAITGRLDAYSMVKQLVINRL